MRNISMATATALALSFILIPGCGGTGPPPPARDARVWAVSVHDLHRSYSSGSTYWTGARIKVRLEPGAYREVPEGLNWYQHPLSRQAAVTFYGARAPVPDRPLIVEGRVRGTVPFGDTWFVAVDGCVAVTSEF